MANNRMLERLPSVAITHERNELKVYQGDIVYLNDGDNFELHFFNPLKEKIGIEIVFNGLKKGDSYLVLNPGQDIILDRFLDEQKKMLFETYNIDGNNKDAVKAIEDNGLITFNFYREYWKNNINDVNVSYTFPPKPNQSYNNFFSSSNQNLNTYTTSSIGNVSYSDTTNTISYGSNIKGSLTGNVLCNNIVCDSLSTSKKTLETGRIEKGDDSKQKLKNVNVNFASSSFYSISYKLMPKSSMNQSIGEIRQYCTECGYRLRKQNWKFCPHCGTKMS